jgi:hypothetical protein
MFRLFSLLILATVFAAGLRPEDRAVRLFNGKNLDGLDTYLKTKGLNHDPERVFQVRDGMLHISGQEYGYVITRQEYENYYLRAEFKWGDQTWPPREGRARDSGILYHVKGPNQVWPMSIEYQIIEGGTGDIILVGGASVTVDGVTKTGGRFNRYGKNPAAGASPNPAGYRDPVAEYEKPHGQWNVLELYAEGSRVKYVLNGKVANEGTAARPSRGRILFQSEGAEVFFRNITLKPLKAAR